jgi:hypothetical protein
MSNIALGNRMRVPDDSHVIEVGVTSQTKVYMDRQNNLKSGL